MIKILFVCTGNICRSPMAEFIMKDLVKKAGLEQEFVIASAATSSEEIGNPVYPPARKKLESVGLSSDGKYAVQMRKSDYDQYDYLVGMDNWNIKRMLRISGGDPEGKVCRLLDFTEEPGEVADPWYTRDFDTAYRQILMGCEAFFKKIRSQNQELKSDGK